MSADPLFIAAAAARNKAHAIYSGFKVGAAVQASDGIIYTGCNVESASYGLTQCAERAAVTAAIAQGRRGFTRLSIWANTARPLLPCGACRQVLAEHAPRLELTTSSGWDASKCLAARTVSRSIATLLPEAVLQGDLLGMPAKRASRARSAATQPAPAPSARATGPRRSGPRLRSS